MTDADYLGVVGAAIGAGLLGFVSAVLKYWLDAKKSREDYGTAIIEKLQDRITHLEEEHEECLRENAKLEKRIGYLEAKVEEKTT